MQKKEFFGALLLVSMVSSIMLAGFVSSGVGPKITVNPTCGTGDSEIESIKGTGWARNTFVTLYWDQQSLNHTIANVLADNFGKFKVEDLKVEGSYIGAHTIIALQGPMSATALYTMKVTTTPDDRILDPIQQLEDKLDNTTSGLPSIQSNLTKIDSDVNAVEGKLDQSGRLGNTTQFEARSHSTFFEYGLSFNILDCNASETAEFTITILPYGSDAPYGSKNPLIDTYWVNATFDGYIWYTLVQRNFNSKDPITFTIAAMGVGIGFGVLDEGEINAGIAVQYRPGTKLTWDP